MTTEAVQALLTRAQRGVDAALIRACEACLAGKPSSQEEEVVLDFLDPMLTIIGESKEDGSYLLEDGRILGQYPRYGWISCPPGHDWRRTCAARLDAWNEPVDGPTDDDDVIVIDIHDAGIALWFWVRA